MLWRVRHPGSSELQVMKVTGVNSTVWRWCFLIGDWPIYSSAQSLHSQGSHLEGKRWRAWWHLWCRELNTYLQITKEWVWRVFAGELAAQKDSHSAPFYLYIKGKYVLKWQWLFRLSYFWDENGQVQHDNSGGEKVDNVLWSFGPWLIWGCKRDKACYPALLSIHEGVWKHVKMLLVKIVSLLVKTGPTSRW